MKLKRLSPSFAQVFAFVLLPLTSVIAATNEPAPDSAQAETARVVAAAHAFLAKLDPQQLSTVEFAFTDEKQRVRWSNLPTGDFSRAGLTMGKLSDTQRSAALALLATVLSAKGFEKVQDIMEADDFREAVHHLPPTGTPGAPPSKEMYGKGLYYISILGTPSEKDPWTLQFGGHHLALNITIDGTQAVLAPALTGTDPDAYTFNGKTVRPLGGENDKAFALMNALDDGQRQQTILKSLVANLVLGPGHDGQTIPPEGLKASAMNDKQRALLLDLISEWAGMINENYAAARLAEIKAGLGDTWFAWSGPTAPQPGKSGSAYYRIVGPKLVIEYAPQHSDSHFHTIYRDPTDDYGRALFAK